MRTDYTTATFQTPGNRAGVTFKIKAPLLSLAYHDAMLLVAKYMRISFNQLTREVTRSGEVKIKDIFTNQVIGTIKVN